MFDYDSSIQENIIENYEENIIENYEEKYLEKFKKFPNEFQLSKLELEEEENEYEKLSLFEERKIIDTTNDIKQKLSKINEEHYGQLRKIR